MIEHVYDRIADGRPVRVKGAHGRLTGFELGTVVHLFDNGRGDHSGLARSRRSRHHGGQGPWLSKRRSTYPLAHAPGRRRLVVAVLASLAVVAMPEQARGESVQEQIDQANRQARAGHRGLRPGCQPARHRSGQGDQARCEGQPASACRSSVARVRLQPAVAQVYEVRAGLYAGAGARQHHDDRRWSIGWSMSEEIAHREHRRLGIADRGPNKYRAAKKALDATVVEAGQAQSRSGVEEAQRSWRRSPRLQRLSHRLPRGHAGSHNALRPVPCPYTPDRRSRRHRGASMACGEIGKPYVWAAAGPNTFDCSGLMVYAWARPARSCVTTPDGSGKTAPRSPPPNSALGTSCSSSHPHSITSACTSAVAGWSTRRTPVT